MYLALAADDLAEYTAAQLNNLFPDRSPASRVLLLPFVRAALERVEFCFRHVALRGYSESGEARFDPLHADQYCAYLYFLSNTVYRNDGDPRLAAKLFGLNKALNAFNCMYDTELPDIFLVVHGMGTVLGKAKYADYLLVAHNCTIGAIGGVYPTMSEKLILSAGASVIGESRVGENVLLEPGCNLVKTNVPPNTRVSGPGPYSFKPNTLRPIEYYFRLSPGVRTAESRELVGAAKESR
jgi:serine O-acetyltransferase